MIIEFIVCVLGCATIGRFWFGNFGMVVGIIIGLYLFYRLRKKRKNQIDYDKIRKIINEGR